MVVSHKSMAQGAKQFLVLLLLVACATGEERCSPTEDIKQYQDVVGAVLKAFNQGPNDGLTYDTATVVGAYRYNDSETLRNLLLDVTAECSNNATADCTPTDVICSVVVNQDPAATVPTVVEDETRCAEKESHPVFPTAGKGFFEVDSNDELEGMARSALRQVKEGGDTTRTVLDVVSIKKQAEGDVTTWHFTLKVAAAAGDASHLEMCELEVSQGPTNLAVEKAPHCFPLENAADVREDDLEILAKGAVAKLDTLSPSEFSYRLDGVLGADKQATLGSGGIVTTLVVRVSPTLCLKGGQDSSNPCACPKNSFSQPMVCTLMVWQRPWRHDIIYSDATCEETRKKRGIAGGISEISADDPKIQELATFVMSKLDESSNSEYRGHLIRVVKATQQVVAGMKYTLTIERAESTCRKGETASCQQREGSEVVVCEVTLWDKPWENYREILSTSCTPDRARRSVLVGGFSNVDVNLPEAKAAADFALSEMDRDSNDMPRSLVRVVSAQRQVVAGIKWRLHLVASRDNAEEECTVEVLEQKWKNHRELLNSQCGLQTRQKRGIPGGVSEISADDPKIQELATFVMSNLDESSNSEYRGHLIRVAKATQQVVAGMKYTLTIERAESTCRKGETANCQQREGSEVVVCEVAVWDKPWENFREILSTSCTPINASHSIRGGFSDVDINHPEALAAANFALSEMDRDSNSAPRSLVKVISARAQIVSGVNWQLRISASRNGEDIEECDVKVFEQTWTNTRELKSSNCSLQTRQKRAITGGISEISVDDPKIQELTTFVMSKLDESTNSLYRGHLVRVVKATEQTVAGTKYTITVERAESTCRKQETANCQQRDGSEVVVCEVAVWDKPWENFRQVLSSSCTPHRVRRSVLVGGFSNVDVNLPEAKAAADFSLSEMDRDSNAMPRSLVRVVSAQRQVVAGIKWRLHLVASRDNAEEECTVEVLEQAWKNHRELLNSQCGLQSRQKRGIPGGVSEISADDAKIQELATFVMSKLDESSNSVYRGHLIRVVKATQQVVAGMKYTLTIERAESSCRKGETANCQQREGSEVVVCEVAVWDKPWENYREILSTSCTPHRARRSVLVGGFSDVDVNLPETKAAADFALSEMERDSNAMPRSLVRVVSAQRQVVAGIKWRLHLVASRDNAEEECTVEVLEQKWKNHRELLNSQCGLQSRQKRGLKGGVSEISADDPKIQELATFVMSKMDESSNSVYRGHLVRVAKATQQVVAGMKYTLTIERAESTCRKGETANCQQREGSEVVVCEITLWDKPWENYREILSTSCTPHRARRSVLVGGFSDVNVNLPETKAAADFALSEMDRDSNAMPRSLVRVVSAQRQVVAGIKWRLHLVASRDNAEEECTVEVLEQKWKNHRELLNSQCGLQDRHSRDLPGGLTDADVHDAHIQDTAAFALVQLDANSNSNSVHKLVSIKKAKTQVVSGLKIFLTVEVTEGICQQEKNDTTCNFSDDAPTHNCDLIVWEQPWKGVRKLMNSACAPTLERRDVMTGGWSDADVQSDSVRQSAAFVLTEMDKSSNSIYARHLVRVVEAKQQLVAGLKITLTLEVGDSTCQKGQTMGLCKLRDGSETQFCKVTVLIRSWENFQQMLSSKCKSRTPEQSTKHADKRGAKLGGKTDLDTESAEVQKLLSDAVKHINAMSNARDAMKPVRVLHATRQVVAGIKYDLTIEMGYTNCRNTGKVRIEECELKENSNRQVCKLEVWNRPQKTERRMSEVHCMPAPTTQPSTVLYFHQLVGDLEKRGTKLGGKSEVDTNSSEVLALLSDAVKHINAMSNARDAMKPVRVLHATRQVVAGLKYDLTIEMGYTSCRNNGQLRIEDCEIKENSDEQVCKLQVLVFPWVNKRQVSKVHCAPSSSPSSKASVHDISGDSIALFRRYAERFNKTYTSKDEFHHRHRVFEANMKKIKQLQKHEQGTAQYGATQFADMTAKEFKRFLGLRPDMKLKNSTHMSQAEIPDVTLPTEFDWRHYNVVTEVKNQGMCGSCWAFSVTGNVEGQVALSKGKLISLSEQELVDCDKLDDGCEGGLPSNAYQAISKLGGLESETDYPYDGEDEKCHFDKSKVQVRVSGGVNITSNETKMAQWLVKNGPISIGINANAMQFYLGGVSHPWTFLCSPDSLDHGVLIVGFGVHKTSILKRTVPYWIIKNSWGTHWGEQGYYRVYRGDGTCGVNQMASSAVLV